MVFIRMGVGNTAVCGTSKRQFVRKEKVYAIEHVPFALHDAADFLWSIFDRRGFD